MNATDESATSTRIVGIGASAGGIEALKTLFGSMPPSTGMAFVVVLHLAPDHDSLLADILRGVTKMPVVQATDGMEVKPNRIYVIAPGTGLTVARNRLAVHSQAEPKRHPFVVDLLFSSLAIALGDKAAGIVLSGTGNDGALGLKAIRDAGGIAMAQGPDGGSTYFDGMPNAAIAVGAVDMFLPVGSMAERLLHLVAAPPPPADDLQPDGPAAGMDTYREAICAILRDQLGHDFSGYKQATFFRRVRRRMQLFGLGFDDYIRYLDRLETKVGDGDQLSILPAVAGGA